MPAKVFAQVSTKGIDVWVLGSHWICQGEDWFLAKEVFSSA